MALDLKVCIKEQTDSIWVQDRTGAYDVTDNPTGWGAPNIVIANVTAATLTLTDPDGDVYIIDVYPDFPVSDFKYYEITKTALGITSIVSGYWTVKYDITHSTGTETETATCFFTKDVQCCVNKRYLTITPEEKDKDYAKETRILNSLIYAARMAAERSATTKATNAIDYVKDNCEGCDC